MVEVRKRKREGEGGEVEVFEAVRESYGDKG